MKTTLLTLFAVLFSLLVNGQQINCEGFKEDSLMSLACKRYMKDCYESDPSVYFQGSRESQMGMDSIIEICPYFAHAYYTKAIPYLKRGDFITWKKLIDQAVEYSPFDYLGYRGGSRFMFLRDYKGAIKDIESLEEMTDYDIGYIYNGDYHLKEIKALSYKGIGRLDIATDILKAHLKNDSLSMFGHLHLGCLLMDNNVPDAIEQFNLQLKIYPFAETYYYLAMVYKRLDNELLFNRYVELALLKYKTGETMDRVFMDYPDKIYLNDIESLLPKK